MDAATITAGAAAIVAIYGPLVWVYKALIHHLKRSNIACERQNAELRTEMRSILEGTVKANTASNDRTTAAINRLIEQIGSGTHRIVKNTDRA